MTDATDPPNTSSPPVPPPAARPSSPEPIAAFTPDVHDVLRHRPMAILSYVGPLVFIPLLTTRDSPFTKFHSHQGLRLFLCEVAVGVAVTIYWWLGKLAMTMFSAATWPWEHGGACLGATLGLLANTTFLALALIGIIRAANGQAKPLPLISRLNALKIPNIPAPSKP